jgi:hypothetical protein
MVVRADPNGPIWSNCIEPQRNDVVFDVADVVKGQSDLRIVRLSDRELVPGGRPSHTAAEIVTLAQRTRSTFVTGRGEASRQRSVKTRRCRLNTIDDEASPVRLVPIRRAPNLVLQRADAGRAASSEYMHLDAMAAFA